MPTRQPSIQSVIERTCISRTYDRVYLPTASLGLKNGSSAEKLPKTLWIHSHFCAAENDGINPKKPIQPIESDSFYSFSPMNQAGLFAPPWFFFGFVFAGQFSA
ncbi:hypothetical protein [Pseudomonas abietaniphila]|uniref:hypothetical protein n=1 Tax=Pseudomonas abietaniphila TaxID=89065 RepID=UPI00115FD92D|nr:hypothetical protein [Pseudomonas abietaniphila]